MPEDHYLLSAHALAHRLDQLVEVSDEMFHGHGGPVDLPVEGFAAPALVPVDDCEDLLQRHIEAAGKKCASAKPCPPCSKINGGFVRLSPQIITY